jgi:hypothetical protein
MQQAVIQAATWIRVAFSYRAFSVSASTHTAEATRDAEAGMRQKNRVT